MNNKPKNLIPFSLEEYIKDPNRKIVTRDGRNVRIICTDPKGTKYSVIALCTIDKESEICYSYLPNGRMHLSSDSCLDLFFAPEKHTAWTNIYKSEDGVYANGGLFESEEEALENSYSLKIATCKIEWEE